MTATLPIRDGDGDVPDSRSRAGRDGAAPDSRSRAGRDGAAPGSRCRAELR